VGTEVTGALRGCETKGPVEAIRLGSHIVIDDVLAAILSLIDWYRGGTGEVAGTGVSISEITGVSLTLGEVSPMVDIGDDILNGVGGV